MGGLGVLVTRTQPGATHTATALQKRGYEALIDPVLNIVTTQAPPPDLTGVQAIVATSAHGVRAVAAVSGAKNTPLFCLSGASFDAASDAGFCGETFKTDGHAKDIAVAVSAHLSSQGGPVPVLWVRGRHFAFDMAKALGGFGCKVQQWEAYAAQPVAALCPQTIAAIHEGQIKAVLFHSARGAKHFVRLAHNAGVNLSGLKAVAMSAEAAKPLRPVEFGEIYLAARPDEAALLSAVQDNITQD